MLLYIMFQKLSVLLLIAGYFCFQILPVVYAQSTTVPATMTITPELVETEEGDSVKTKIIISSESAQQISFARAYVNFDPELVELKQVIASTLFCQYPQENGAYASDNTEGVLIITGQADGTAGCDYPEIGPTPVEFAEVTYKALDTGLADIDFSYSGTHADGVSTILGTGASPAFLMTKSPSGATFKITSKESPETPEDLGFEPTTTMLLASLTPLVLTGAGSALRIFKKVPDSRVIVRRPTNW